VVDQKTISGTGERYSLTSAVARATNAVALDSVVGVETFQGKRSTGNFGVVSARDGHHIPSERGVAQGHLRFVSQLYADTEGRRAPG
jgi:hypothetical protein